MLTLLPKYVKTLKSNNDIDKNENTIFKCLQFIKKLLNVFI